MSETLRPTQPSRAAKQTQLREKGKNIVKDLDVDDTAADIQNLDNALVIAMGEVYADEKLEDKVFGVSHPDAIKLRRACQMYQYREKSERVKKSMLLVRLFDSDSCGW